jgi:hypothetical protein
MDRFDTKLTPEQEGDFLKWKSLLGDRGSDADYDLRGWWLKSGMPSDDAPEGHFSDEFKKPNHPTFSDESVYHGTENPDGTKNLGGKWVGNDKDGWGFAPTPDIVSDSEKLKRLKQYLDGPAEGGKVKIITGEHDDFLSLLKAAGKIP